MFIDNNYKNRHFIKRERKTRLLTVLMLMFSVSSFSQNLYSKVCKKVDEKLRYGVVLNDGTELIPMKYDFVCFNNLVFVYKLKWQYGFIERSGKKMTNPIYNDCACSSSELLMRANYSGKWGFLDQFGKVKIDFQYEAACNFNNGEARVETKKGVLTIDKNEKVLSTSEGETLYECYEDMLELISPDDISEQDRFSVKSVDDKKGVIEIIDGIEKVVIPFKYQSILYHNKIFSVKENGLWGAYNENGDVLFESKFERPLYFESF